jgi:glycosyltransferase involved in cell wall biosynthesis
MAERALWLLDDGRTMGGGQRFGLRLLRHARDAGREAVLVAPAGSRMAVDAAAGGLRVVDAEFPAPSRALALAGAIPGLRRALREAPADALVVAGSARCQLLSFLSGSHVVCLMHEQDSASRPAARLLRHAGPVVAMGANAQAAYAAALGRPVARIDNVLETGELDALVAGRTDPPGAQRPVLGMLGRLIPEKGVLELVQELAAAPDAWERVAIGAPPQDGAYAAAVERRAGELGVARRVSLDGEVGDVPAFLASLDVLVVPSTGHEGQPTVILEALACGRPVVVRRPVMSPDYEGLPIFAYDDSAGLVEAIAQAGRAPVVDGDVLRARFTPDAALAALEAADAK